MISDFVEQEAGSGDTDAAALRLAAATVNGIKYLVTWSYTHLANPELLDLVQATCRAAGFTPPRIVTPDQLIVSLEKNV